MGCITSKGVGRSMGIHDRFNQGLHALSISEDFHMTSSRRDRIITLIKIASGKNLTGFRYNDEINNSCTKPCSSVKEEQETKTQASETTDTIRTFHTLEEFEELMEKVKLFEARIIESEHSRVESESVDGETTRSEGRVSQDTKPDDIQIATTLKNLDASAGWKRKAMGRQLESLVLPISIKAELSSVGSLKEWINAGEDIYSPETYVTPKFGSYANERREFGMFSPELVAAFEDCMRQMEVEEAGIVKQMEESSFTY